MHCSDVLIVEFEHVNTDSEGLHYMCFPGVSLSFLRISSLQNTSGKLLFEGREKSFKNYGTFDLFVINLFNFLSFLFYLL